MNNPAEDDRPVLCEMAKYHVASPSAALRQRILRTARAAWATSQTTPAEVSWVLPAVRFAACLAAALLVAGMANLVDQRSMTRERAGSRAASAVVPDSVLQANPGLAPLVALAASRPEADVSQGLLHHVRRVEELLQTPPPPGKGTPAERLPHGHLHRREAGSLCCWALRSTEGPV
jgi:hypothetical protein